MSGSIVCNSINNFLPGDDIVHLQDRITRGHDIPFEAGVLQAVSEPEGQPFALAHIRDIVVEVPVDQASRLQQLVGRTVCLAIVDGKFRVGALA